MQLSVRILNVDLLVLGVHAGGLVLPPEAGLHVQVRRAGGRAAH